MFSLVILPPAYVYASQDSISAEQADELGKKNLQIKNKIRELDDIGKELAIAKARDDVDAHTIERLELESDQATVRLESLQKINRETPDTIAPEKLRQAEDANKQAIATLNNARSKRDTSAAEVILLNSKAEGKYAEFILLEKSFERDVDMAVNTQVNQRIRSLQSAKTVEVSARVSCGEETIKQCKERSLKAAELAASEQGSVVFVTSLTEVKNFKLSKEELRSEVQATLSKKEIVKQQMIGEAEAYETTLKANVEPVIGDTLRDRMAESIRAEIYALAGGQVDYTQVRDPSLPDEAATPPKKTDARSRIEARRAAKAEEEKRRKIEAAQAAEEQRRAEEAARAQEERRKAAQAEEVRRKAEEEQAKAAKAEDERRRSGIPTINF